MVYHPIFRVGGEEEQEVRDGEVEGAGEGEEKGRGKEEGKGCRRKETHSIVDNSRIPRIVVDVYRHAPQRRHFGG